MIVHAVLRTLVSLAAALLLSTAANAQLFRAYLAIDGNDANPCTLPAPCRLLPAALAAVQSGGEVWMLDSANYNTGTVGINKSVTILAVPGVLGSVISSSGNALTINGAGIDVTLQNLNIRNSLSGDIGVNIVNASSVTIKDCSIFGFNSNPSHLGIWMNTGATGTKLTLTGTTLRNNSRGLAVNGNGRATVSRSSIIGNGIGLWSTSNTGISVIHVSDTVATGNGTAFAASGSSGAFNSYLYASRVTATENTVAFSADGGITAYVVVGDSLVTNNGTGFSNTSGANGAFQTRGNNTVTGNTTNVNGTVTAQAGV